jgi:hypothetical protein
MKRCPSLLLAAGLLLPACARDHEDAPGPDGAPLVEGEIGAAGGRLEVAAGAFEGSAVEVPPGALAAPARIAIRASPGGLPASIYAFDVEPAGLTLLVPARVTVKYSAEYPGDFLLPPFTPMVPVSIDGPLGGEIYEAVEHDVDDRLVSFDTTRLGRFSALLEPRFAAHWHLLGQDRQLTAEARVRGMGGEELAVSGARPGARAVAVGKGGPDAFWAGSRNLILVHATADDAQQFVGTDDLIAGLDAQYDAILTYQYRSGRPIAENANWLYNEVKRRAGAGFRTDVLGYSMGGLVARYFIERSKDDPARAGLSNYEAAASQGALSGQVRNLFTLGTPHQGAVEPALFDLFDLSSVVDADLVETYFPSLKDLSGEPGGFVASLNAGFVNDPAIRYFLVAGSAAGQPLSLLIPGDDDGLVSVASALGVPGLAPPEAALVFLPSGRSGFTYTHSKLHSEAVRNGVRDQLAAWISLP